MRGGLCVIIVNILTTTTVLSQTIDQKSLCGQANSGGISIQKCYFYINPPKKIAPHSSSGPRSSFRPRLAIASSRCEPGTENTVMRRSLIVGDPGSGIGNNVSANPGDNLMIRFQLGDRCYFRYCVPQYGNKDCFNASVNVNSLFEKSFIQKIKIAAEKCEGITERDEFTKCMKAHGITRPPLR